MTLTIAQYYKGFRNLHAALAAIPFIPALLNASGLGSEKFRSFLYPPLGDAHGIGLVLTVALLVLTTLVVFLLAQPALAVKRSIFVWLAIGAVLSSCLLIGLYVPFVRTVQIPRINQERTVSIGYERTDFANKNYPRSDDWEMLEDAGPWEEEVHQLWTARSMAIARALLWLSYTLTEVCLISVVSLAVLKDAEQKALSAVPPNQKRKP